MRPNIQVKLNDAALRPHQYWVIHYSMHIKRCPLVVKKYTHREHYLLLLTFAFPVFVILLIYYFCNGFTGKYLGKVSTKGSLVVILF